MNKSVISTILASALLGAAKSLSGTGSKNEEEIHYGLNIVKAGNQFPDNKNAVTEDPFDYLNIDDRMFMPQIASRYVGREVHSYAMSIADIRKDFKELEKNGDSQKVTKMTLILDRKCKLPSLSKFTNLETLIIITKFSSVLEGEFSLMVNDCPSIKNLAINTFDDKEVVETPGRWGPMRNIENLIVQTTRSWSAYLLFHKFPNAKSICLNYEVECPDYNKLPVSDLLVDFRFRFSTGWRRGENINSEMLPFSNLKKLFIHQSGNHTAFNISEMTTFDQSIEMIHIDHEGLHSGFERMSSFPKLNYIHWNCRYYSGELTFGPGFKSLKTLTIKSESNMTFTEGSLPKINDLSIYFKNLLGIENLKSLETVHLRQERAPIGIAGPNMLDVFKLKKLKKVQLSIDSHHNPIKSVELLDAVSKYTINCTKLEELDVTNDYNRTPFFLSPEISKCKKLKVLSFKGISLKLPKSILKCKSINTFHLNNSSLHDNSWAIKFRLLIDNQGPKRSLDKKLYRAPSPEERSLNIALKMEMRGVNFEVNDKVSIYAKGLTNELKKYLIGNLKTDYVRARDCKNSGLILVKLPHKEDKNHRFHISFGKIHYKGNIGGAFDTRFDHYDYDRNESGAMLISSRASNIIKSIEFKGDYKDLKYIQEIDLNPECSNGENQKNYQPHLVTIAINRYSDPNENEKSKPRNQWKTFNEASKELDELLSKVNSHGNKLTLKIHNSSEFNGNFIYPVPPKYLFPNKNAAMIDGLELIQMLYTKEIQSAVNEVGIKSLSLKNCILTYFIENPNLERLFVEGKSLNASIRTGLKRFQISNFPNLKTLQIESRETDIILDGQPGLNLPIEYILLEDFNTVQVYNPFAYGARSLEMLSIYGAGNPPRSYHRNHYAKRVFISMDTVNILAKFSALDKEDIMKLMRTAMGNAGKSSDIRRF